ncbi:MAG TPA: DUF445 domain-containing protein [Verrucomicrobiae bacterium]|nr:DUF445 domain-containing protein [Verrucomicrobiae bacterium]
MNGRGPSAARRPPRQRRLALLVLLAAVALAAAAVPFRATWWGGWILAIAEAGIVGGLADWFAVTALFRHPLGLPIPHTAIIPANWELMAERVGVMVGDRVLTKDYVRREVATFDLADLLARGAERLRPADLESAVRAVARWAAEQVSPGATTDLAGWLTRLVRANPIAPVLATGLEIARRQGWDQRLIEAMAEALIDALDRPDFRSTVGDLVDDVLAGYRAQMSLYPRVLMGLANTLGLIDRERLVSSLHDALKKIAGDPDDPLRVRLTETLAALPGRLRADPELAARLEAAKEELLASPALARLVERVADGLRRTVIADLQGEPSEVVGWITARLDRARRGLAEDAALRQELDRWLKERVTEAVDRYHDRIARFIERGVHALGPEGAVRLIEEHAGDDLQYIRVNGTVVGGLAGGGLYAIHLLLERLLLR